MQMRRLALDKADDIAGTQAGQGDGAVSKTGLKKPAHERYVVENRGFGR